MCREFYELPPSRARNHVNSLFCIFSSLFLFHGSRHIYILKMKGVCAILLCFLSSINVGVARLGTYFNRSLVAENRSLFDEYEYNRSLFNRSLEYDVMYVNRSLFNRSLESMRLMKESIVEEEDMINLRGIHNRTLQSNRTLEADDFEQVLSGQNRSLGHQYYNRSLFSDHYANRSLYNRPV